MGWFGHACGRAAVAVVLGMMLVSPAARAERIVLAPGGFVLNPGTATVEYVRQGSQPHDYLGWVTIGVPQQDLGLELEVERLELGGWRRTAVSAQYSLTGNALSDIAPAISVGVRDLGNSGREGRAFYGSLVKTFGMSRAQERVLRDWKLHLGVGTSHLDGVYAGVEGRLAIGVNAAVEYARRKWNASATVPVGKHFSVKAYSLDGTFFYGAELAFSR